MITHGEKSAGLSGHMGGYGVLLGKGTKYERGEKSARSRNLSQKKKYRYFRKKGKGWGAARKGTSVSRSLVNTRFRALWDSTNLFTKEGMLSGRGTQARGRGRPFLTIGWVWKGKTIFEGENSGVHPGRTFIAKITVEVNTSPGRCSEQGKTGQPSEVIGRKKSCRG